MNLDLLFVKMQIISRSFFACTIIFFFWIDSPVHFFLALLFGLTCLKITLNFFHRVALLYDFWFEFHLQHEFFFFLSGPLGRFCVIRMPVSFDWLSRWALLELRTRSVIARNISSTWMFSFADVSNSWMPIWEAKRDASSFNTTLRSGSSHLLPTRTRLTSSQFWLISCSHLKN